MEIRHGDLVAWVDDGIAELVLACWRRGLTDTVASCESWSVINERVGGDNAYIAFGSEEPFETFLSVVEDCSRATFEAQPDADLRKKMRNPTYADDARAKGAAAWAVGFPSADIDRLTASLS